MAGVEEKSLFKRVMFDKDNTLNKKEFIISYLCYWVAYVALLFLFAFILNIAGRAIGIGLGMGFVMIFMQRLKFLGMNKYIGAVGIFPLFNVILFIFLAVKSDDSAVIPEKTTIDASDSTKE